MPGERVKPKRRFTSATGIVQMELMKSHLPWDLSSGEARIMSKVMEKDAHTIKSLSMKSSSASLKIVQNGLQTSGGRQLLPKCSVLYGKSAPVRPVSKFVLSLSIKASAPTQR